MISIKTQVKEDLDEDMVNKPIETKEVVVNINRVLESDFTNGVSKDSNSPKKEEKEEEEEEKEEKTSAVVLNGSSESILNGDDHDRDDSRLQSDEIKKEDDLITCEEKVKADSAPSEEEGMVVEGVKEEEENGEAMDQDTSRDPEPTPEPPEPPEDKGPKLEKAIYEEEIVDGFNFCSFETYPEVEVRAPLKYLTSFKLFNLFVCFFFIKIEHYVMTFP